MVVRRSRQSKKTSGTKTVPASPLQNYFVTQLDSIDKKLKLRAGQEVMADPTSSSLLCVDWVLSGGFRPAFYQISGMEASSKSTLGISFFGQCIRTQVPLLVYNDAEGAMTPEYSESIFRSFGMDEAFNDTTRRYYSTNVLEDVTRQIATFVKRMPDKYWEEEAETWAYHILKGQKNTKGFIDSLAAAGVKPDKSLTTDSYWVCPTEYSGPEAAFFVDSWPALIPNNVDEQEDGDSNSGLALRARVLSEEIPKFAGRLKKKGVILYSVNQLRDIPMSRYGPTQSEPGGNALKFYPSVKCQMASRAVPPEFDRDPDHGGTCIEESVQGNGYDRYQFKAITNTKNKFGKPFLKSMTRVWTSNYRGEACGYDPVFDTINYLVTTGQLSGTPKTKKGFTFNLKSTIKGNAQALNGMQIPYPTIKAMILAEHYKDKALAKQVMEELEISKPILLRAACFNQLKIDDTLWSDNVFDSDEEIDDEE